MNLSKLLLSIFLVCVLFSCSDSSASRPSGADAKNAIMLLNKISRPLPKGNPSELYSMLSQDFVKEFTKEIELAKTIDSLGLRKLPKMKMLRILSLKNSFSNQINSADPKTVITNWIGSSGKGFPLTSGSRYYYSDNLKMENEMLKKGNTFPQILLVEEEGKIKVNLFNTADYQKKRMNEILKKKDLEELIKSAAWLHIQTQRSVKWD